MLRSPSYPCKSHMFYCWTRCVSRITPAWIGSTTYPCPAKPTNHLDIEVSPPVPHMWSIGHELIVSRRPLHLLGFGCVDERPKNMERWGHLNFSRREIYHVRCERGALAPPYPATSLSHVSLVMGVCRWKGGQVQRRRTGLQGMSSKYISSSHLQTSNTDRV